MRRMSHSSVCKVIAFCMEITVDPDQNCAVDRILAHFSIPYALKVPGAHTCSDSPKRQGENIVKSRKVLISGWRCNITVFLHSNLRLSPIFCTPLVSLLLLLLEVFRVLRELLTEQSHTERT